MDWMDPFSVLFLLALTLAFLWKMSSSWNGSSHRLPPGPKALPLIGNLHQMDLKRPYSTMLKFSKQYGPVYRIQLGWQKMVVLAGYEMVKEALVNQADAFADRPSVPIFDDQRGGHGIVFSNGEAWKVMRRFAISTLRDYGMGKKTIEDRIVKECRFLLQKFESFDGKPFETATVVNGAASNIIVSILLGKRLEYEDPTFKRLLHMLHENIKLLGSRSVLLYNTFPALGILFGARKTIIENLKEMHDFIQATFIEHLKVLDENDQRSFIDAFLIRQKEEKNKNQSKGFFHSENLKAVVNDLFAAGTETASTTLCWGLLLMMKYPEIQRKVQEEMTKVIGSAQLRIEHRAKLPYTNAVVHEIQRFANISPMGAPHATSADVTLGGYFIPKISLPGRRELGLTLLGLGQIFQTVKTLSIKAEGMHIVPLLYSVLYDESQWEKPFKFYPEHFLDSNGKFVKRDAFLPFSAGRRACAGETLAKMELFLFFASLLQRFTFQPAPGTSKEDLDLTPVSGITLSPMPYRTCALPRS